jgi:hypothetical protein
MQEPGKNCLTRKTFYDSFSPDEASKYSASENETEFRGHASAKFIVILRGSNRRREKTV